MKLYHLTAIPPTAVSAAVNGSFTAPKQQELIVATPTSLELFRLLPKQSQLTPLLRVDAFCAVRALSSFRLPGAKRDYLLLTSDAGTFTVLSPDLRAGSFRRVHAEPFGRSGARPSVPGHFIAADPRGRAALVAALARNRLAYVLNRDAADALTVSSPLDARAPTATATLALAALDVGFENPLFASLERPLPPASATHVPLPPVVLALYELDLGLNCVVRKQEIPARVTANLILPVPGAGDGPGGALVCADGWVSYHALPDGAADASPPLEVRLPRRAGTDPATLVVAATMYHDRKAAAFFFLLCTEFGDLIKADLKWSPETGASELRLAYFDSLPAPATAMIIFRSGFLFVALEGCDSLLLKFRSVDVPDDAPGISMVAPGLSTLASASPPVPSPRSDSMDVDSGTPVANTPAPATPLTTTPTPPQPAPTPARTSATPVPRTPITPPTFAAARARLEDAVYDATQPDPKTHGSNARRRTFTRNARLQRLSWVMSLDSLAPALALASVGPRGDGLLLASGRGRAGSVRLLRRGQAVFPLSTPHPLPARARAVFSLPARADTPSTRLLVVAFSDRSRVLVVQDGRVDETKTSGLELSAPTFAAAQMGAQSLVQIHSRGVRFLPDGKADVATEWKAPVPARIVAGACNSAQAIVALSSGAVVYFELDVEKTALLEVEKVADALVPFGGDAAVTHGAGDNGATPALAIAEVPSGRKRSPFFAVGDGANAKVRLYRVGLNGTIESLGVHLSPAPVESLALVDFAALDRDALGPSANGDAPREPMLTLVIGTRLGAVVRLAVDAVSGSLGDKRNHFIGPGVVRARALRMGGVPVCVLSGPKPWLLHGQGGQIVAAPLGTEPIDDAAPFTPDEPPDGFVSVAGASLSLQSLDVLHALQAAADLPAGVPPSGVPAVTALGASFQTWRTRLSGTPRKLVPVDERPVGKEASAKRQRVGKLFVVIETDHRAAIDKSAVTNGKAEEKTNANNGTKQKPGRPIDVHPAGLGSWFSRLQLVRVCGGEGEGGDDTDGDLDGELDGSDPLLTLSGQAVTCLDVVTLTDSVDSIVAATSSATFGPDSDSDTVSHVIVSTARNLVVSATAPTSAMDRERMKAEQTRLFGALVVYRVDRSHRLIRLHETRLSEPAHAVCAFRDMVAVGVGTALRLYALGKKQVLRKVEFRQAVSRGIAAIASAPGGDRLFVADRQESVTLFRFIHPPRDSDEPGRLTPIAMDSLARWVTCLVALDRATVAVGDKFGCVVILRLPTEAGEPAGDAAGDQAGAQMAQARLDTMAGIHVGATVTALTTGRLCAGGNAPSGRDGSDGGEEEDMALVYATAAGGVGVLKPMGSAAQADALARIERAVRMETGVGEGVSGRDHVAYRGMFYGTRNVIDGDMCEKVAMVEMGRREAVGEAAGRDANDVARRVDEARAMTL